MSTILNTVRWLSIVTGALSLFYLGHAWFEFGLGDVFTRIHAWYASIFHPVTELLRPVAVWVVGHFGWTLPEWWRDATLLYLSLGGSTLRGGVRVVRVKSPMGDRWSAPVQLDEQILKDEGEEETRKELWLAPFKLIGWPLFWLFQLIADLHRKPGAEWNERRYMGPALEQFGLLLAGALIFAGLNAGL